MIASLPVMGRGQHPRKLRAPGLFFPALGSGLVYALLAYRSRVVLEAPEKSLFGGWQQPRLFEESLDFLGLWVLLVLFYAVAVSSLSARRRSAVSWILLTAVGFRVALFFGEGFHVGSEELGLAPSGPIGLLPHWGASVFGLPPALIPTLFDLGSLLLLPELIRRARLAPNAVLIYAWNPLVVKEVAGSGREEAVALFFLLLTIRVLSRDARTPSILGYASCLMGPLPFLATLPALTRYLRTGALVSLALAAVGWMLWPGIPDGSTFEWLRADFVGASLVPSLTALSRLLLTRNPIFALLACQLVWLLFVLRRAFRPLPSTTGERFAGVPEDCLLAYGGFLMVAPVVMPWSFVPLAGLAAFSRNRGFLVFTATAPLTYLALGAGDGGQWSFWLGFAQYFPAYAALVFFSLGERRASPGSR